MNPQLTEVDYIYFECQRQHVTNYGDFAKALDFAKSISFGREINGPYSFNKFVQRIAELVEPEVNRSVLRGDRYSNLRVSEVGFANGGTTSKAVDVLYRFNRWCEFVNDFMLTDPIDGFIKSLLDIHPWADGNGRTASILRNWMLNRLETPDPLPYYYE